MEIKIPATKINYEKFYDIDEIEPGEVFSTQCQLDRLRFAGENRIYYLKTTYVKHDYWESNAINLLSGSHHIFDSKWSVYKVDVKAEEIFP